jgi:CelD/BcsL family acetyltransferase involved in cellulose biosynthesis
MSDTLTRVNGALEMGCLNISSLSLEDRAGWRELASHGSLSAPFVDEAWVASWIEAFRPREPMLLCAWEERRLVGLAALQHLTEYWAGRKIAVLQSLTNIESARFEFLSGQGRREVQERLWRVVCDTGRCDVIRLDHLPEGSPTLTAGLKVAAESGWRGLLEQTFASPWRPLSPPPVPWDQGLARKFKANLRNRERRLEALGDVTFEVASGTGTLGRALQIYYELDGNGWKGEHGVAVVQHPDVKAFYDRLVDRAPEQIWIPILSVSGQPAAAQFLLVRDRTVYVQKTAYNLAFSPYTPGQLLTARVIRYGLENEMDALDFLAANMTWKADWAPQLRPHYRLLLFAPTVNGRYAYWMRYGLRESAKKVPGARRFVPWLRSRRSGT